MQLEIDSAASAVIHSTDDLTLFNMCFELSFGTVSTHFILRMWQMPIIRTDCTFHLIIHIDSQSTHFKHSAG